MGLPNDFAWNILDIVFHGRETTLVCVCFCREFVDVIFQRWVFISVSADFYYNICSVTQISQQHPFTGKPDLLWSGRTVLCSAASFICSGKLWFQLLYVLGAPFSPVEPEAEVGQTQKEGAFYGSAF